MIILGHRGDGVSNKTPALRRQRQEQGKLPENTLSAIRKAIDTEANGVEFDVIMSADGRVMVIHDNELEKHVIGGDGLVSEKTCAELQQLDVGQGNTIPTLEEVIEICGKKAILNIELKGAGTAKPVIDVIDNYVSIGWDKDKFLISSFDNNLIKEARDIDNNLQVGLLFKPDQLVSEITGLVEEYHPFSLHPDVRNVTEELLEKAKQLGLVVVAWTVDEVLPERELDDSIQKLVNFSKSGYDIWLITDFPKEVIERKC